MMRYLDEQGGDQKEMYARLVRSQLSSNELYFLLLTGLSERGREKMEPLIERYALLKHLPPDDTVKALVSEYEHSAFDKETPEHVGE